MSTETYCCEDFKEAVKELVISNYDPSWSSFEKFDFNGCWYILRKEMNWVQEVDYDIIGNPLRFCPWCMTPIISNDKLQ